MKPLTDHQIELLEIIDCVRWGEEEKLGPIEYHQIRRAVGVGDPIIFHELKLAVDHELAHNRRPPPSPPPGPERSPWILDYFDHDDPRIGRLMPG